MNRWSNTKAIRWQAHPIEQQEGSIAATLLFVIAVAIAGLTAIIPF